MLNPFKMLRKVGKFIRGGVGSPQIIMGCLLGLGVGMTVGFNALTAILIALLILLNASGFLAALCIVLGKVLSLALAPVTFRIGYVLIHKVGLEGFFRSMGDTPVVALMNMHNYCQVGNLLIAVVLGLLMGMYISRLANGVRRKLGALYDAHDRIQRVVGNPLARFFTLLLFGKAKGSMKELAEKAKFPLFRKGGIVIAVIVLGLVCVGEYFLAGAHFEDAIEQQMTRVVGAEVNVKSVTLSPFQGRVEIAGLQVTDPEKPTHNAFQAEKLVGAISFRDLLTKRLTMENVEVSDVRTDAPRETPGKVYVEPEAPTEPWPDDLLTDFFANWEKYRDYLERAKEAYDWMQERRQESTPEEDTGPTLDDLLAQARRDGYQSLDAQAILAKKPTWTIRNLKVEGIRRPEDPAVYNVTGTEITSHPSRTGEPMRLTISSDRDFKTEIVLHYEKPGQQHELNLNVPDVDVAGLLGGKSVVQISKGNATVSSAGRFTSDAIDLPVQIVATGLEMASAEGKSIPGMQPAAANELLKNVKTLVLNVGVVGPVYAPRLKIDDNAAKDALVAATKGAFKSYAEEGIKKAAGDLLNGALKKDADKKDDEKKSGPLDGFLKGL